MKKTVSPSPFHSRDIPDVLKKAQWIWADNHQWDLYNCYALFRKTFTVGRVPARCELAITADQSYQLYLNGTYICRGPARGFQSHWPYDVLDVAAHLRPGKNVIAIRAYHPGVSNFQYISQGFAGLLVGLKIGKTVVVSENTWRYRRQEGVSRNVVPSTLQLFPAEQIDARQEDPDWMSPGFDDSGWKTGPYARPWNAMPWPELEARGIPFLDESLARPGKLIGTQKGKCAPGWQEVRDVVALRASETFDFAPAKGDASPLPVPAGKATAFTSYLIDFNRTAVGCLELEIEGALGGEIIDAAFAETLAESSLRPDIAVGTHCRLALGVRLICRSGANRHRFYHPAGFRYLVLTVRGNTKLLEVRHRVHGVGYPLEVRGAFSSSDPMLEKIWETCVWTQKCCSLDAYVDTPWREQAQWWGDARVQGWNTFHLNGDTRLFRRGIHCIAGQTTPDGVTYGHAPTIAHECILPDFTLIWLLTLWDYYWQTGSTEPFQTHLPTVLGALDYFESQTDEKTGLLRYDGRYWLFLDWSNIFKDGYASIYSLWYLQALDKLAALARLTGETRLLARVTTAAKNLRRALTALIGKNGLMCDGLTWKRRPVPTCSVQSQTLAIMNGLNVANTDKMIRERLLPIVQGKIFEAMPSPYWLTFIYSVLIERGYQKEVVADITRIWTPMAEHGTTWEVFNPVRGQESFSHAWSAHPLYHLAQTIGGIRQTAPGWKKILFQPGFIGDHGGATIPSPNGPIRSSWKRVADQIEIGLTLPKGTEASVVLPGKKPITAKGPVELKWRH